MRIEHDVRCTSDEDCICPSFSPSCEENDHTFQRAVNFNKAEKDLSRPREEERLGGFIGRKDR